jgi:hypothetical protein
VAQWTSEGVPDREIARRLGADKSAVNRHRRFHIVKPNLDRAAIIAKDREAREHRRELAVAAASHEPPVSVLVESLLGLKAQALKIQNIEARLENLSRVAEGDKALGAAAQLAGAQLRSVEVGSRLAGTGGYAPQRTPTAGAPGERFSISIILGDKETHITTVAQPQPPVIEQEVDLQDEGDDWKRPK